MYEQCGPIINYFVIFNILNRYSYGQNDAELSAYRKKKYGQSGTVGSWATLKQFNILYVASLLNQH